MFGLVGVLVIAVILGVHKAADPTVDLAKRAGVSLSTVQDFERGQRTPIANNIAAMRRVREAAGVRLVFDERGNAVGIRREL